ncbi:8452_t:CDS:2 [Ambispora gerdemannii]|uniref:8452_t:CDS:1 n=1 Tax=Ambispora gerdemannii TaxID=144530 RepID=A0A9N8Z2F3_9GLOM|nr:8452_t:CDS:2 [Ambispora gerdemannii]
MTMHVRSADTTTQLVIAKANSARPPQIIQTCNFNSFKKFAIEFHPYVESYSVINAVTKLENLDILLLQ